MLRGHGKRKRNKVGKIGMVWGIRPGRHGGNEWVPVNFFNLSIVIQNKKYFHTQTFD